MGTRMRQAENGGARRDRTDDLLHAMQALSQLSYGPTERAQILGDRLPEVKLTGMGGSEQRAGCSQADFIPEKMNGNREAEQRMSVPVGAG